MEPETDTARRHANAPGSVPIEVAAGLIFHNRQLLIAQRYADSHLGGLWEFPGGKREADETYETALVRELREELGVTVAVGELIECVEHAYPDKTVRIKFFKCQLQEGQPAALGCHDLKWIQRGQLREQLFPEADAQLLKRLAREDQLWMSEPSA